MDSKEMESGEVIVRRQEEPQSINMLKAMRHKYSLAKRYGVINFLCCIAAVCVLTALRLLFPQSQCLADFAILYSASASIAKVYIVRMQTKQKRSAASIQQMFDCYLYDLPWDEALCGDKPSSEEIYEAAKDEDDKGLHEWYKAKVLNLSKPSAVLACMRINATYDKRLKEKFKSFLYIGFVALILFCLSPMFTDFSFHSVMLKVFVPILPMLLYCIDVNQRMKENIGTLDKLNKNINECIEKRKRGEAVTQEELAKIQNLIFVHRTSSFAVPDFFYRWRRKGMEESTSYSIENLCKEMK